MYKTKRCRYDFANKLLIDSLGNSRSSTLLYPVSLLFGCWNRWLSQKSKYQEQRSSSGRLTTIYFSGSLFSVFWVNWCKECQFSLHVYRYEKTYVTDHWSACDIHFLKFCNFLFFNVFKKDMIKHSCTRSPCTATN